MAAKAILMTAQKARVSHFSKPKRMPEIFVAARFTEAMMMQLKKRPR